VPVVSSHRSPPFRLAILGRAINRAVCRGAPGELLARCISSTCYRGESGELVHQVITLDLKIRARLRRPSCLTMSACKPPGVSSGIGPGDGPLSAGCIGGPDRRFIGRLNAPEGTFVAPLRTAQENLRTPNFSSVLT
jgi:hypothetical protein